MANRAGFEINEWYHCFNRGVDKRIVFEDVRDYERFLQLLYLANSRDPIHLNNLPFFSTEEVLAVPRSETLVVIAAYSLMPNHFHLLLKEKVEGGITSFMRKLGVGYAMYFNIKRERTGNLFMKPFRSRHVADDRYFQYVVHYIHFNVAELHEPGWKSGSVKNLRDLERRLLNYRYSSFGDYQEEIRPTRAILGKEAFSLVRPFIPRELLKDAIEYYHEMDSANVLSR